MDNHNLNHPQRQELISLHSACKGHNRYVSRGMARITEQLVELGYAERFHANDGRTRYRITEAGNKVALMLVGDM